MFSFARRLVRICIGYLRKCGMLDFLQVTWPTFATPIVVALAIWTGYPRVGMAVLFVIYLFEPFWWSCLFGLTNVIYLLGGGFVCLGYYVQQLREAALEQLP